MVKLASNPQITVKGKASSGLKAEHTRSYVSISIRGTTQPLAVRWGIEANFRISPTLVPAAPTDSFRRYKTIYPENRAAGHKQGFPTT